MVIIKEQIISFETAKLAKKKGFDIETMVGYTERNKKEPVGVGLIYQAKENGENVSLFKASTQSLLQKWLREEYDLQIEIKIVSHQSITEYTWAIFSKTHSTGVYFNIKDSNGRYYDTYEKALELGLQEALKLI